MTAALLAATLLPGIGPAAADVTFTFQGGGWGHVVGLSQYGAYGMAREGYSWEEILTHYFTGASPGDADPALLATPIWVGLAQEQSRLRLTVVPTGAAPASPVTFTLGGAALVASSGDTVVVEPLANGRCRLRGPAGSLEGPCSIDAEWDGWEAKPTTAVQFEGCSLPDWNAPGGTVWKPCRYARGGLRVRPDNDTATVNLSLQIGIEDYILGISESPYAWGTTGGQAALEAQAAASRSYALYRVLWRGDPASRPWCWCQLYDTTADQFYAGWGHGTQPWLDAVAATAGKVMLHPSETRNGALVPIQTVYGSSTFGWTENSENSFTAPVAYLRAVDDHWSTLPEVGNPKARWSVSFTAAGLASRLPGLSTVTGARVTRCSETGAALEITFTGEGGPRAFSTRDLRSRLSLPSLQVINVGAPPSGAPACSGFALAPAEPGGPASLAGFSLNDDTVEDSNGNGDGLAQCGESVEVLTTLANQ
ncbi:MAG TPA: SpoIID/LytB domain-containing protein, partial [Acidimicrobiia bacterium]|nr:SpoIID/LytB domain-containing protein [Acidimicrobiia bacterium]